MCQSPFAAIIMTSSVLLTTIDNRRPTPLRTHMHIYRQGGCSTPRPRPRPRIDAATMARLAAISGTLLAALVTSPQAGLAFVPAPAALAGATNGLWGSAAPAASSTASSTAASTPVPAGFFGPTMQGGRRRGVTTMMAPPAAATEVSS